MEYNQEVVNKMLADPRWQGAITPKMARVWKNRGVIPDQYFNKRYVELTKKSDPAANQIKDPYFNEKFILKMDLTEDEKRDHDRIVEIIRRNEKINAKLIIDQCGFSYHLVNDATRPKDDKKFVYLRPEHVLSLKKNLQELRIKIKELVTKFQDKKQFWERDKQQIQQILNDDRLFVKPLLENDTYYNRWSARKRNKMALFEDAEAAYAIERLSVFLLETAV